MRQFLVRVVLMGVVLMLATGMAVLIARQESPSRILASLHFTDCTLPCWMGINWGTTAINDAEQAMMMAFDSAAGYRVVDTTRTDVGFGFSLLDQLHNQNEIHVYCDSENGAMRGCSIWLNSANVNSRPTAGELIAILGKPDYARFAIADPYHDYLTLGYIGATENVEIWVNASGIATFDPADSVDAIYIYRPNASAQNAQSYMKLSHSWRGFTWIERFLAQK